MHPEGQDFATCFTAKSYSTFQNHFAKGQTMSNKVVRNTFQVSKILLLFILQQFGRNVEDTSLQQNGRHGRLELLQCPHDFGAKGRLLFL